MWNLLWPIALVVAANTAYNIASKSTPADVNPFVSLFITYAIAALACLGIYVAGGGRSLFADMGRVNWTAVLLGLSVVGLEFGWIAAYRAGWKISTGFLVQSVCLTCVLLLVGFFFYKETLSLRQAAGMLVCLGGLFLVVR